MYRGLLAGVFLACLTWTEASATVYHLGVLDGGILNASVSGGQQFDQPNDSSQFEFALSPASIAPLRISITTPDPTVAGSGPADFSVLLFGPSGNMSLGPIAASTFLTPSSLAAGNYTLQVTAFDILPPINAFTSYDVDIRVTPLPAALPLLGSALAGLAATYRRRRILAKPTT